VGVGGAGGAGALRHKRRPGREGGVLEGEVRTATAGARGRGEQSAERGGRSAGRLQREAAAVAVAAAAAAAALRHKRRPLPPACWKGGVRLKGRRGTRQQRRQRQRRRRQRRRRWWRPWECGTVRLVDAQARIRGGAGRRGAGAPECSCRREESRGWPVRRFD